MRERAQQPVRMSGCEPEREVPAPRVADDERSLPLQAVEDGQGTTEDFLESMRLVWPAYFADPDVDPDVLPLGRALRRHRARGG